MKEDFIFKEEEIIDTEVEREDTYCEDYFNVANKIVPSVHSMRELEQYLINYYKATPYHLSAKEIAVFKMNVMEQYGKKAKLDESELLIKAYGIKARNGKEIIVQLEMKSGEMIIKNGSSNFCDELFLWQGISKEDIKQQTPRFHMYMELLKKNRKN